MKSRDDLNVIFDMDGVIFDTEKFYIECCVPAAERLGLEGIEDVALACTGLKDDETKKYMRDHYGEDAPLDEFHEEVYRVFMRRFREEGVPVKSGVRELLAFLKSKGAGTAIGSSTQVDIIKEELADAGLIDYFDAIVGGDMVSGSKPEPDVFLLAAKKLGVRPQDCFIIEDSFNGIKAARSAGGIVIMVPDLRQPTDEIRALADFVFDSLEQVRDFFARR